MDDNSSKTILVVDDSKQNLKLMTEVLESEGYIVLQALSGSIGLKVAQKAPPHLVLLDICMPEMDGFETCKLFKSDPELNTIPIIFLSGLTEQHDKIKAFEHGGVDYIEKPVQPKEMLVRVDTHIQLYQMQTSLKDMVDARTRQLLETNQMLINEISQRKEAERKLRLDEERLESLLKLNEMFFDSEEQIIIKVLQEAVQLTGSNIGFFHYKLQDNQDTRLVICSNSTGKEHAVFHDEQYPIEIADILAKCAGQKKTVVHNNCKPAAKRKNTDKGEFKFDRHMSVPIFENKQIIAIIGVGNKDMEYEAADIRQLTLFSQGMWRLIDRIRYEQTRKILEDQLAQAQKMEAIGTLAGGIAHDFNNILMPIIGYAELEIEDAPKGSSSYENLNELVNAGHRARELVKQILTFSRKGDDKIQPTSLQPIIKETLKLIKSSLPSTIAIKQKIDPECGQVLCNAVHIHQIIMNLCTNAYHAMKGQSGHLKIILSEVKNRGQIHADFVNETISSWAMISVSDTGCGMTKETKRKIFEPYFTTKKMGEGTGLGMSVVHGIIGRLRGNIQIDSIVNKGTTITIYIPIWVPEIIEEHSNIAGKSDTLPGGHEHILAVDDEPYVLRAMSRILSSLGYKVTIAQGGEEALNRFEQDPARYALVLTDLTMPGLTGIQLAQKLLAIKRKLPVILCTGTADKIMVSDLTPRGIKEILFKPILRTELAHAIRRAIDSQPAVP